MPSDSPPKAASVPSAACSTRIHTDQRCSCRESQKGATGCLQCAATMGLPALNLQGVCTVQPHRGSKRLATTLQGACTVHSDEAMLP